MKKRFEKNSVMTMLAFLLIGLISCQKQSLTEPVETTSTVKYLDESDPSKIWDLTATRPYEFIGEPMQQWVLDELEKDAQNRNQNNGRFGVSFEWSGRGFSNWATQQSLFGHTWDAFDYGPQTISSVNYGNIFDLGQLASYPSWNATPGFSIPAHTFGKVLATNTSITPYSLLLTSTTGIAGIGLDPDFGFNQPGNSFMRMGSVVRDISKLDNAANYEIFGNNIWNTFRLNFNGQFDKVYKDWASFSLTSGSGWGGGIILDPTGSPSQVVLNAGHLMMKVGVNGDIQEIKFNYAGKITEVYTNTKLNAGMVTSVDGGVKLMTWQMDALGGIMGNIGTSSDKITVSILGGYNRDNSTYFGTGGLELTHGPITGVGSIGYNTNLGVVIGANINIKF